MKKLLKKVLIDNLSFSETDKTIRIEIEFTPKNEKELKIVKEFYSKILEAQINNE